jgi:hypothetical protein
MRAPEPVRGLRERLGPGDRVLGWAPTRSGHLVATLSGLWLLSSGQSSQLRWEQIDRAVWGDPVLVAYPADAAGEPWKTVLDSPGRVPALVRERVEASIAVNAVRRLSSGGRVRIVARRRFGEHGLAWNARFERPADARDPAARAQADAAIAEQQALLGE